MSARITLAGMVRGTLLLTILALPFVVATSAQAHALLQSSTPADGTSYDRSPQHLGLVFTEAVQVDATSIQLYDGAGRPIDVGSPVSVDGAAKSTLIDVPLPSLPKDRYLVRWRTISSDDLHPTAGSIVFGVGTGVSPAGQSDSPAWTSLDSIAESVLRWVALMAIGFALACLVLSRRLVVMRTEDAQPPLLPRATALCAAIGTATTLALSFLYFARIADVGGWLSVTSDWQFTLRWVAAVGAGLAAWLLMRGRAFPSRHNWLAIVLLVLSLAAITSSSHPTSAGALTAVLGGLHTVSTMAWACGAAAVAVVAVPSLRCGDRLRAVAVARAFTPIALVTVPVSLVTGLVLAGRLLPSVGALTSTDYGHTLTVKLGLLAIGLLCAGATVWLLVLGGGRHRVAMVVGVEAVLLGAVVLAASTLAATHPASKVVWAPTPDQASTSGVLSDLADDLVITADVGPGRPGRNFVTVGVLDTRRPAPAPIAKVEVSLGSVPALTAVPQGQFQWLAVANVPVEGPTPLVVTVRRPGEPLAQASFTWRIGPAVGTRLGGAELQPITTASAIAVVAVGAIVALLIWWRYRRRRFSPAPSDRTVTADLADVR